MIEKLIAALKQEPEKWEEIRKYFKEKEIPSKTVLLREGNVSRYLYIVRKGCLRLWFNKDGKDITAQFFFEGQGVSSMDSFFNNTPSEFTLESIEPCTVFRINKTNFDFILDKYPDLKEAFHKLLFLRVSNYAKLFLSRIKDSPQERYEDLLKNHPDIISRVPQHYIASYLGITPISLSRIRKRIK